MKDKEKVLIRVALDVYMYLVTKEVFRFDYVANEYDKFPKKYGDIIHGFDHMSIDVIKYILKRDHGVRVNVVNRSYDSTIIDHISVNQCIGDIICSLYDLLGYMPKDVQYRSYQYVDLYMSHMFSLLGVMSDTNNLSSMLWFDNYDCVDTKKIDDIVYYEIQLYFGTISIPLLED